jgi:YVTN family beta-propeller protein
MPELIGLDARIGTEFLGYRLEALVGRGGMGVVFRAYDLRLKRNVALKLVAPEYAADESFRDRFLVETEVAASLEHPAVVPIHDAGEVDGQLYLAMRFVEGTDLRRLLINQPVLEPTRALAIVTNVATALDAAHERGLVHRDVKPSNVLLDEREHPYLADFGLTRRLDDSASPTVGLSVGTPAYVAPEQIRGDRVDGRADQYALACVFYECLAGEPPFRRASEVAMLFAHLEDEPLPLASPLDPVFAKALAKDPSERYATCEDFGRAARDALLGAEPRATWRRRVLLVGLAAVLAAAVAIAVLTFGNRNGGEAIDAAGYSVSAVDPALNRLLANVAVGTAPADLALDDDHAAAWVTSTADGTVDRIDLRERAGQPAAVLTLHVGAAPDGIAVGDDSVWVADAMEATVSRIDRTSNEVTQTIPVGLGPARIVAGRGAVWVVNRDDSTLTKIDPRLGLPLKTWRVGVGAVDVALGAGSVWVTSAGDGKVLRIHPGTGRILGSIRVGRGPGAIAASRGAVWVVNTLDATISRIDTDRSKVTATVRVGSAPSAIAAAEDAVWVADEHDGSISRIDLETNLVSKSISVGASATALAIGGPEEHLFLFVAVSDPRTPRIVAR